MDLALHTRGPFPIFRPRGMDKFGGLSAQRTGYQLRSYRGQLRSLNIREWTSGLHVASSNQDWPLDSMDFEAVRKSIGYLLRYSIWLYSCMGTKSTLPPYLPSAPLPCMTLSLKHDVTRTAPKVLFSALRLRFHCLGLRATLNSSGDG
jgi:hypothetical protein